MISLYHKFFQNNYSKATDKQVLDDHRIVHAWWATIEKSKKNLVDRKTKKIIDKEEIIRRHKKIVSELKKRNFKHNIISELDKK